MSNIVTIGSEPPQAPSVPAPAAVAGQSVQLTDRAVKRVRIAMAKEGISSEEGGLRLGVMGGGCSGLSYSIKFDTRPRERDRVFEFDGVCVSIPSRFSISAA